VVLLVAVVGLGVFSIVSRGDDVNLDRIHDCTGTPVVGEPSYQQAEAPAQVSVRKVADLEEATTVAPLPDGELLVGERAGRVLRVDPETGTSEELLDISSEVTVEGELGLIGLETDGDYVWVSFAGEDFVVHVVRYDLDGDTIDVDSRVSLLEIPQAEFQHKGGNLLLGADGLLYVGVGDGGDSYDSAKQAQALDELNGKILRLDPYGEGGADGAYGIPEDNPFVNDDSARPEVWLYGLRNPWRFSFAPDGSIWIADVGSNCWEEIDHLSPDQAGSNLGWPDFEAFNQAVADENDGSSVFPVYTYSHDEGCAVVGGYEYSGEAIPELDGIYVFADWCRSGVLRWLREVDGGTEGGTLFEDESVGNIVSFAEGSDGQLYVLSQTEGLYVIEPAS